jgi:predicted TIM-barrel fold metal-dependent hydrolase
MEIINCHIHTFTEDHVPDKFIGYGIDNLLRIKPIRGTVFLILKNVLHFTDRDLLDRYVRFAEIASKSNQQKVLKIVMGYYPESTKFVILPMDMEHAEMGYISHKIDEQHQELAELCKKPEYQGKLFPFVAVDPRRDGILEMTKNLIENEGFRGIKIYPPLGYFPQDPRLDPLYEYAQANNLPVMTHCSRGGVYTKGDIKDEIKKHPHAPMNPGRFKNKDLTDYFTDPFNYKKVFEKFPNLKICLAHFGGDEEWEKYLDEPWDPDIHNEWDMSWLSKIRDMLKSGDYPNLYTDISYTILSMDDSIYILNIFMEDPDLAFKIMFGTDFYMVEREKKKERRLPMKLRSLIGEDKFRMIAETNPKRYLNIT